MKKILFLIFTLSFVSFNFAFAADPASTNYQVGESYFPSGMGNAQSTNYKVDEGMFDSFPKTSLSSTNYAVQGKIGISGDKLPFISSISPSALSRFHDDESAAYTVTAVSPDSETLSYEAVQDSTSKDGPQASSSLTWALSSADVGRHTNSFKVSDPDGTVLKQQAGYVFRRPVK